VTRLARRGCTKAAPETPTIEGCGVTQLDIRVKLTVRQQAALAFITARPPVASDELGAYLHARRAREGGFGHDPDRRCGYCHEDGRAMGRALAKKGLVRRSREGWVTGEASIAPRGPSAQGDLPEDY